MFKIFTVVAIMISASATYASSEFHLYTLDLVETMLWNEGVNQTASQESSEKPLPEELEVALDLLDS